MITDLNCVEQICLLMSSFTWSVIEKLLIILDELGQRFLRVFPGARIGPFQSWLDVPVNYYDDRQCDTCAL